MAARVGLVLVGFPMLVAGSQADRLGTHVALLGGPLLLPPEEQRRDVEVERWIESREIHFSDLEVDPWQVPRDPDWSEDPYASEAWLFRYHSLAWLQSIALAAERTGDPGYLAEVRRLLFDWIGSNPRGGGAPSDRAWYDHATAIRTDVIVWLYREHLAGTMDRPLVDRLLRSLRQHGRALRSYLDLERFRGHNHSLFHAMSLYNLATVISAFDEAAEWRNRARSRISELLGEMVDLEEGVSTEQAAVYHTLALRLFLNASDLLEARGEGLNEAERDVLARMSRFGLLITDPAGRLPAVGDTRYGARQNPAIYERAMGVVSDPVARFLLTAGRTGTRPPDAVFYPRTGWAVFRPDYSPGEAWLDDLHVVMRAGPDDTETPHGHEDAMSFTLVADGVPWIVDSGGPYRYDDPWRADFVAAWAHNTVVVDGARYGPGDATIIDAGDVEGASWVLAEHQKSPGVTHRRALILLKPRTLIEVDLLDGTDGLEHDLSLLHHLAADASVAKGDGGWVARRGPQRLSVQVAGATALELDVVRGQRAPISLGHVTPAIGKALEAPVLRARQRGQDAWFVTILEPGREGRRPDVEELSDGLLAITLAGDDRRVVVSPIAVQFGTER